MARTAKAFVGQDDLIPPGRNTDHLPQPEKQSVGNGLDRSRDIFAYAVMRFPAGLVMRCGNDNTANHFANVQ